MESLVYNLRTRQHRQSCNGLFQHNAFRNPTIARVALQYITSKRGNLLRENVEA